MDVLTKRVIVIYKDLPKNLENYVAKDKHMTLTKNGAIQLSGVSCARVIISIDWFNDHRDKERIDKLVKLLNSLQRNNQIFEYTLPK